MSYRNNDWDRIDFKQFVIYIQYFKVICGSKVNYVYILEKKSCNCLSSDNNFGKRKINTVFKSDSLILFYGSFID